MAQRTLLETGVDALGDLPPIRLVDGQLSGELALQLSDSVRNLIEKVNGLISLGNGISGYRAGNLNAQYIDHITPSVANTEFVVPHGLGRKPVGYMVVRRDKAAVVYDSSAGSWTDTLLYLKCDTGSTSIRILVW